MSSVIQFTGKDHVLQLFGVRLPGITPENGKKLLMTLVLLLLLMGINRLLHAMASLILGKRLESSSKKL